MSRVKSKKSDVVSEELEVSGKDLLKTLKKLIKEGNIRRLMVRKPDGSVIVDIPLTVGAAAGTTLFILAPFLSVIGVAALFLTQYKIIIIRN